MNFKKDYIAWTALIVISLALIFQPGEMRWEGILFLLVVLGGSALTLLILGKKK